MISSCCDAGEIVSLGVPAALAPAHIAEINRIEWLQTLSIGGEWIRKRPLAAIRTRLPNCVVKP